MSHAPPPAANGEAPFYWTAEVAAKFPPAFVAFLKANDIHPDNYSVHDVPRYVRVSPHHAETLTRIELERQLGTPIEPVAWLAGYFSVPSQIKIAGCDAYTSGKLFGIDVSSGAAVAALDPQPGDDVLDLCCAPGAKLCAIGDRMGHQGTLTGVDVSEERLAACRTLCLKYGLKHARLVLQDGCAFATPPPRRRMVHEEEERQETECSGRDADQPEKACDDGGADLVDSHDGAQAGDEGGCAGGKYSRKRRRREQLSLRGAFFLGGDLEADTAQAAGASDAAGPSTPHAFSSPAAGYDKVLVDAECTHDGSIKHLAKFAQWGWDSFERRFLEPARLETLALLQLGLLRAGFRALRAGGVLVYSTCSFARAQNEAIVEQLLGEEATAELVPIDGLVGAPCRAGMLPHTLRFEPRISRTSGLFIARIAKRRGEEERAPSAQSH